MRPPENATSTRLPSCEALRPCEGSSPHRLRISRPPTPAFFYLRLALPSRLRVRGGLPAAVLTFPKPDGIESPSPRKGAEMYKERCPAVDGAGKRG